MNTPVLDGNIVSRGITQQNIFDVLSRQSFHVCSIGGK